MNASPKNTTLEFKVACAGIRAHADARRRAGARSWRSGLAAGKSEFGLCGVVGVMMVIELLAGTMRLDRISPEAIGRAAKRALAGCGFAAGDRQ